MQTRILIHAPVGKDAWLATKVLENAGLRCHVCADTSEIMQELNAGAGALFIVEEALAAGAFKPLAQYVLDQPTWSDIPILVLTNHGVDSPDLQSVVEQLGNFTLLERPVRAASLISAARSAMRARMRQYQMREADQLKDEFLASLGHELRNPLAPIRTAVQVLNHKFPNVREVSNVTEVVERQVAHLTRLVDDLLDVARVTSGKVTLQRKHIKLAEVVDHAVEICSALIEMGRHRLEIVQPDGEVMLDADPARLVQSLANVLANAAKFSPDPSTIVLDIRVEQNDVIFRVKDSGIGLESNALARIFEMFTQSNPVRGQVLGGLGIGLSLTKRFVEMHGGTIYAISAGIGQGCEFVLTLPIVVSAAEEIELQPMERIFERDTEGLRVLIVDDNSDGADMLEMMLEMDGYTVFKAHEGQQAVETTKRVRPHVVLMDIGLPDIDGYEAARQIRQQPDSKDVVVIALTGWGHEDARRLAAEAGMDHHLVKPVHLDELRSCLARFTPRAEFGSLN